MSNPSGHDAPAEAVHVTWKPETYGERTEHRDFAAGTTLAEIAAIIHPDATVRERCKVEVDGEPVERDSWTETRPRAGAVVAFGPGGNPHIHDLVVRRRQKIPSGWEPLALAVQLREPGRGYHLSQSHH